MAKPKLKIKPKNCDVGTSCKNTCITKTDECQVKLKNPEVANNFHNQRQNASNNKIKGSGGFSDIQQTAYNTIVDEMTSLFTSEDSKEMFKKSAANYKNTGDVQVLGDIRHQLDGGRYDKILDNTRAASGLDSKGWNRVYNKAKNKVNGVMVKQLLESKGNC